MQKLVERDFLAALVLFFIGAVSLIQEGPDMMNWVFPTLATYVVLVVATVLTIRVFFPNIVQRTSDVIGMSADDKTAAVDVLVFLLIVLVYLLVMYGLGFWVSSLIMLSLTSVYLTLEKTPRNIALALIVPLFICITAYVIFLHVFYVPLPQATWWAGIG